MIDKIDLPDFGSIVFPTIKKVAAKLIATELVSVQPLSAPTGQLFFMGKGMLDHVKYFERDEFYAYDDHLQEYLGDNYPDDYLRTTDEQSQPPPHRVYW